MWKCSLKEKKRKKARENNIVTIERVQMKKDVAEFTFY